MIVFFGGEVVCVCVAGRKRRHQSRLELLWLGKVMKG